MRPKLTIIALTLLCLTLGTIEGARGAELEGVTLPDRIDVAGTPLELNGLGLRKKAFIKVYVAGLYLVERQTEAQAILAADSPRRLVMELKFGVGAEKMCAAWRDGLEGNTPDAPADVREQFETLCTWMDDLAKKDRLVVTYQPGEGTSVEVRGSMKGVLEGKAFADALFACWLGPKPPSGGLKAGLLGL